MFLEPSDRSSADRPVLVDARGGRTWSGRQLIADINRRRRRFDSSRRLLTFLFCRNQPDTVLSYFAVLEDAHPVVLLGAEMSTILKRSLIELYKPELILAEAEDGQEIESGLPPQEYVREPEGDDVGVCVWRCLQPCGEELHPDLALLLSTSGSTGSPKLVRLTRRNLEANAASICASLDLESSERAISSLPLQYSYGLSVLNSHRLAGASVVLSGRSVLEAGFWDRFRAWDCTSFAGVPYTYQMLARIGFERLDLPSLRIMTQAGGKLAPDLIRRFHDLMTSRNGQFFVMYGATEATARMACLPSRDLPRKLGAAGRAIPSGTLLIESGGVASAMTGHEGEVVYQGPNVMMGYATTRSDLNKGDDERGRLHTGDIGYLDDEGYLYITGREKRIAKVFGLRVSLDEIENALRRHGPTAVVGSDDKVIAYCGYGDREAYIRYAQELASLFKIHHGAFEFRRLEQLPLTANGKVDYRRLEQM